MRFKIFIAALLASFGIAAQVAVPNSIMLSWSQQAPAAGGTPDIVQSATNSANGTEVTVTLGSTPVQGNYVYVFVSMYSGYSAPAASITGYTEIESSFDGSSAYQAWRKEAGASESTSITIDNDPYSDYMSAIAVEIENVDTTTYVDGSASSLTTATINPVDDDSLPLAFLATDTGDCSGLTEASGWTVVATQTNTYHCAELVERDTLTSGTGGISHTWTGSTSGPVSYIGVIPPN